MTLWHCAPEPEDVIASRHLTDGRELAVFRLLEERRSFHAERVVVHYIAGEVVVDMSYTRTVTEWSLRSVGYALVVTDDAGLIEKWRTLARRRNRPDILKLFENFKEGDDERRTRQTDESPRRRAAD
jgi:hypothetical protein